MNEKDISWLVKNWDKIDDKFKTNLAPDRYSNKIPDLPLDEHIVILLIDRQKPSVIPDYSFDEERLGITRNGKILYGFDSGCSCPSPWNDNYPSCYNIEKDWKQFTLKDTSGFDSDWQEEAAKKVAEIKESVTK